MTRGLIIAAPASRSGKTVVTLALLRHFRRAGLAVSSFKVGPDYIDPGFHAAASGRPCLNLDPWAMRADSLRSLAAKVSRDADIVIGEGVMGLFDGAPDGTGSTADLARLLGLPVILVVDARSQSDSAAALVRGFATHRADVPIAGVVFNRVGSPAHAAWLRAAMARSGLDQRVPVLGAVPREAGLTLPERHLGLVQAGERDDLAALLDRAADIIARQVDCDALRALARPFELDEIDAGALVPPLGQRIAVARDHAFSFSYTAILDGWSAAGAEIAFFSPLADEAPDDRADAVYLPGGYPELHAARLAGNGSFLAGLRAAAERGATLIGECGGYMALGEGLVDEVGGRHAMAGLLGLETSFEARRLHLGYREITLRAACPLGPAGARYRGHEFHYATVLSESSDEALFHAADAAGNDLGPQGQRRGRVMGSFLHLIDRWG